MAPIQVFVQTRRPHRSHGYYCAICPFSSGGKIIQKKKKPYADYDLRPRPMAWAQVKKNPYADYDACPRPMAWARVIKTLNIERA